MPKIEKIILELQAIFKQYNDLEIAFSGGVGVDGFLGRLTRRHKDVDVDVLGVVIRKQGLKRLQEIVAQNKLNFLKFHNTCLVVKVSGIKVELNYIQIIKENKKEKRFIYDIGKGRFTISNSLFQMKQGRLGNLVFNVRNPLYAFAEKLLFPILHKTKYRSKDVQDLNNLIKNLNSKKIKQALEEEYKNKIF